MRICLAAPHMTSSGRVPCNAGHRISFPVVIMSTWENQPLPTNKCSIAGNPPLRTTEKSATSCDKSESQFPLSEYSMRKESRDVKNWATDKGDESLGCATPERVWPNCPSNCDPSKWTFWSFLNCIDLKKSKGCISVLHCYKIRWQSDCACATHAIKMFGIIRLCWHARYVCDNNVRERKNGSLHFQAQKTFVDLLQNIDRNKDECSVRYRFLSSRTRGSSTVQKTSYRHFLCFSRNNK